MKSSLSVIIPTYCEVDNLENAFKSTLRAIKKSGLTDYEIIIATTYRPDGTDDGTPALAHALAREYPNIVTVLDDGRHEGIGCRFRQGLAIATKGYVTWVPSDNEVEGDSLAEIYMRLGESDIIAVYTSNPEVRKLKRRFVSRGFVILCNLLFGLNLKYFSGLSVIRRDLLGRVPLSANGFAFMPEILIYLIKSGVKYIEAPMRIRPTTNVSNSFRVRSILECIALLAKLFWRINILRHKISRST